MERYRILNVFVPVVPGMSARILCIFMRNVQRIQVCMELAVVVDQKVVDTAVNAHRGQFVRLYGLDKGIEVVRASDVIRSQQTFPLHRKRFSVSAYLAM